MKQFSLSFLLFIISISLFAKQYTVTFKVKGYSNQQVLLANFEGDRNSIIDTVDSDVAGVSKFIFDDSRPVGMYKVVFGHSEFIDFIFNKEDITILSDYADIQGKLMVVESDENKVYFDYLKKQLQIDQQIDVLNYAMDNYPQGTFYKEVIQEYNNLVKTYSTDIDKIIKNNKDKYCSKLITVKTEIYPPAELTPFAKSDFKKAHYFDNVDFSDTTLIYSDIYTQKAIGYLSLYSAKHYTYEQQYNFFKQAIDTILDKTEHYPAVYDFIVDYLISGFESMKYTEIVTYISEQYLAINSCENADHKTTLQRKALSNKEMLPGRDHPEFSITLQDGSMVNSTELKSKYVLLMFWATWCPHCRESLPQIKSMFQYKSQPFDFVAVSLDTNKVDWNNFITQNKMDEFFNYCDGEGWDGKLVDDFNVYASPTFFLLYDGKIIAKPIDVQGVGRALQENGLLR